MGMEAEKGDRPQAQACHPKNSLGQSEDGDVSHGFMGAQFEEERTGRAIWNLLQISLSLSPFLHQRIPGVGVTGSGQPLDKPAEPNKIGRSEEARRPETRIWRQVF